MNFTEIALSDASIEAKVEAIGIVLDKKVQELENTAVQTSQIPGPKGEKGDKGDAGKDGKDGVAGKDGKDGVDGKDGKDGEDGEDGVGVANAYIDFDNTLVLELTDGNQINAGDLNLEELKKELVVRNGSSGGVFDPNSLPSATNYPFPDELIVKQNGQWVRATFNQFVTWLDIPNPFDKVLTEADEPIITENSDNIIRN